MAPPQSGTRELQFVNVSEPRIKSAAQRTLVRKHVMKRYWKGIKEPEKFPKRPMQGVDPIDFASNPSDDLPLKAPAATTSPTCMHRFLVSEGVPTVCRKCGSPVYSDPADDVARSSDSDEASSGLVGSPYVVVGNGDRDPFQTFPIPTAPYTEYLIRHWVINLTPSICTLDVGTSDFNPVTEFLVPFCISDPALFHSLMCFSSSLVDARFQGRDTSGPATLHHMGSAIKLINEALNDPQKAVSDTLLATICLVAANNLIFRDCQTHSRHADGIDQIVALRGGIHTLHPAVFGLVIWVDQFRGLYSSTLPRYTFPLSPSTPPAIAEVLESVVIPPGFGFWSVAADLSADCLEMMEDIRNLTKFMDVTKGPHTSAFVKGSYYEKRGFVEHRLVVLLAESTANPATPYEQCCYLAAFLYHNTVLRPVCVWSGVHQAILGRLKAALLRTDLENFWGQDIELLLWVLMTAIPSALADPSKPWMETQLKRVLRSFGPTVEVEYVKNVMRRFLWHEKTSGPNVDWVYRTMMAVDGAQWVN